MAGVVRVLVTSLVALGLVVPSATPVVAAHRNREHHARAGISSDRLREPQFVTPTRGYALVDRGRGQIALAVTLDGGRRWTPLHHPAIGAGSRRARSASAVSLSVTHAHLLVWGSAGLFAGHQNGRRWTNPITDHVGQVADVGSSVWATTWSCAAGTRCRGWLQVSRDFGRTWTRRAPLPRGVGPRGGIARLARDTRRTGYLVRPGLGHDGAIAVTADGGRSWTSRPLPHQTEHESTGLRPIAVGADGSLWLAVPGEPSAGSEVKAVYRSHTGGRSWQRVAVSSPPRAAGRGNLSTAGYVVGLHAVGADGAYLVLSRGLPLHTTDGGRHWHDAFARAGRRPGGDDASVWLDTRGSDRGWLWLDLARQLWTTRDGGVTWSPVRRYPIRRHLPTCGSDQLHSWLVASGSQMSQPYARIALRNVSSTACAVHGYPRIVAWGRPVGGSGSGRLAIDVRRGAFTEAHDRGPRRIGLRPGSRAVFSVGTATAYSAHLIEIGRLDITLPGSQGSPLTSRLGVYATAPRGAAIPVFVTAVDWRVR